MINGWSGALGVNSVAKIWQHHVALWLLVSLLIQHQCCCLTWLQQTGNTLLIHQRWQDENLLDILYLHSYTWIAGKNLIVVVDQYCYSKTLQVLIGFYWLDDSVLLSSKLNLSLVSLTPRLASGWGLWTGGSCSVDHRYSLRSSCADGYSPWCQVALWVVDRKWMFDFVRMLMTEIHLSWVTGKVHGEQIKQNKGHLVIKAYNIYIYIYMYICMWIYVYIYIYIY